MKSGWGGQPPPSSPSDGAPAKAREARKFFSIVKPLFWILLYSGLIHRILPHLLGCTCTIMGRARPFPNEVATPMTKLNPHKVRQKFCNFWEFLWKIFAIFCIKRIENGKFIWSKINKNKVAYTIIGIPPKNYFLFFTKIFFISKKIIPPPSTHPIMLEILPTTETPHRAPNPSLHVSMYHMSDIARKSHRVYKFLDKTRGGPFWVRYRKLLRVQYDFIWGTSHLPLLLG